MRLCNPPPPNQHAIFNRLENFYPMQHTGCLFHLLQGIRMTPIGQQSKTLVKDQVLQISVECSFVWDLRKNLLDILRPTGLHLFHFQVLQGLLPFEKGLLVAQLQGLSHAHLLCFCQLCDAPGPTKQLQISVHCHNLTKGWVAERQERHHVIKLVHFALDALPVRVHRQCRVENLGGSAVAYRMRNVCHWIHVCSWVGTTNSPVLIDCKGTNPVGLVHALLLSQHPLHNRHASSLREKLSNELKGMFTQRVSDDTGQQVAKVVGPIVRYHLVREHLRVVDHVRIGAGG
mmetsp:Transcript_3408/g.5716  ORF Transcript_3408/g.5716 Transcript_3408/m.5716 type:complete len:288 (-) Transcript_3408:436-1299(-)